MKALTRTIVMTVALASAVAHANIVIPQLRIETTRIVDNATGLEDAVHKVDGIEIRLTQKDKIQAKYWGLNHQDWAKYKFLMEYTPRGKWSPDIDPPIALGNMAKSKKEQQRYAKIMNELEMQRRQRELSFQKVGIEELHKAYPESVPNKPGPEPKGEFSSTLPKNKYKLNTMFVDWNVCDQSCEKFVMVYANINPKDTKLDIYFANAATRTDTEIAQRFSFDAKKITTGDVNIARSNELVTQYAAGEPLPMVISSSDNGSTKIYAK